jgi:hypothetical protein
MVTSSISANVQEHAPSPAGARANNPTNEPTTDDSENKAAGDGCCVSSCSESSFSFKPGDIVTYQQVVYRHGGKLWKMRLETTSDLDDEVVHSGGQDYQIESSGPPKHSLPQKLSLRESEILSARPADHLREMLLKPHVCSGLSFLPKSPHQETEG